MALQNYQTLLATANRAIASLPAGTQFMVKELFKGTKWSTLSRGERLFFGRLFKQEVVIGNIPNVIFLRKADNNSAIYQKL